MKKSPVGDINGASKQVSSMIHFITLRTIYMKLVDAIALLNATSEQEKKILAEITQKIADLQASVDSLTEQLANVELSDDQTAAVQAVVDNTNALDAIVPDEIPPAA
jgi:hypothetical protein